MSLTDRLRKKKKLPPFVAIGRAVLKSPEWLKLSSSAKLLYIYIKSKYAGSNNGEIILPYSELAPVLRSSKTISRALKQLVANEWIEIKQKGGLYRKTNIYTLTFKHDDCRI